MSFLGAQDPHVTGVIEAAADDIDDDDDDGYADSTLGSDEARYQMYNHIESISRRASPVPLSTRAAAYAGILQQEIDRLNLKHHMSTLLFDGKLHFAPISRNPHRILDLGTGSGKWAVDAADEYPMAHVIATDITPIQPTVIPPNLEFLLQHDYNNDWNLPQNVFDLVFSRWNHLYIDDWRNFIRQAYISLRPGGYIELHEELHGYYSDDGTYSAQTNLYRWNARCREAMQRFPEREVDLTSDEIVRYMRDVGFEDVVVRTYKVPMNGWPKDETYKEIGRLQQAQLLMVVETGTKVLLKRALDIDEDESMDLVRRAMTDMKNRAIHAYQKLYVIYGRKPDQ
ncbi:hypothetical protein TWF703_002352 [Orbilia oligospora]|uniref:Methyltransferase domain-containing protein n=1 Tax=Orbilia oligospora TaxID=2813651 RepID=A0A7C8NPG3_ORBOL|nr:hypothetical protein TWF703_002352 [Orbilia oligospora]